MFEYYWGRKLDGNETITGPRGSNDRLGPLTRVLEGDIGRNASFRNKISKGCRFYDDTLVYILVTFYFLYRYSS